MNTLWAGGAAYVDAAGALAAAVAGGLVDADGAVAAVVAKGSPSLPIAVNSGGTDLEAGSAGGGATLWDMVRAPVGGAGGMPLYEGSSAAGGWGADRQFVYTIGDGTLTKTAFRDAWGVGKNISASSFNVSLGFWPNSTADFHFSNDAPFTVFNTVMFDAGHTFANMTNCIVASAGNTSGLYVFSGSAGYEGWGVGPMNGTSFGWLDLTDGGTGTVTPFSTTITATTGKRYQVAVTYDGAGTLTAYVWEDGVYKGSDTHVLDDYTALVGQRLHCACQGSASGGVGASFYSLMYVGTKFDPSALGAT